jgi:hypothetical protein
VASELQSLADSIAGGINVTAHDGPVEVTTRTRVASGGRISARPAVNVTLAHPGGLGIEAKTGALVKAAAAAGLQVKRKA